AKRVMELALEEAQGLGHGYIGTEHILLGLIREKDSAAARILIALSYQLDSMEAHLFRNYICQELQHPTPMVEQIFLYGGGSIN
ncbi:MAG: Clp protease N-terminal domain-containing protein, partial [Segatella oulorum]